MAIHSPPSSTANTAGSNFVNRVASNGFAIAEHVVGEEQIDALRKAIEELPDQEAVRRRTNVYGIRNLLDACPEARRLAASAEVRSLVCAVLGEECFAVRATFFDKVEGANWSLGWHQDSVIAVADRVEAPGFTAWAQKAGVWQVRPPESVLSRMLAIRVHLDDCPRSNGALRVLAGSHNRLWPPEQLAVARSEHADFVCEVEAGSIVAIRPLLLHASSASESPGHRRVIHIEFARDELPGELEWANRIGS